MNKKVDIARALKDKDYYESLSEAEKALVPSHPAGSVELSDEDLAAASGGLIEQTGTGTPSCSCMLTQTAVSGGGHCDCHCDADAT